MNKYGNLISGMHANTLPKPEAQVGDWATILYGRDRHPAKITEIVYAKNGKIKGYWLQRYSWKMDSQTEGYAVKNWQDDSKPELDPRFYRVVTHGKRKGCVEDALIGHADPFYDRSF